MEKVWLITLVACITGASGLFFLGGYKTAMGIVHARMSRPVGAARKPSMQTVHMISTQAAHMVDLPGAVTDGLEVTAHFWGERGTRRPSSRAEKAKKEPLQRARVTTRRKTRVVRVPNRSGGAPRFYVLD